MPDNEKQIEEKKTFKKFDPFSGKAVDSTFDKYSSVDYDVNNQPILGLDLNKETGNTVVVVTGYRDIQREIQEFKDDCGFEGMRKLIAQGRAQPKDFYDDGAHGLDVADLPDNVNDAYRAALSAKSESGNLFADLGVKPVYNRDGSLDQEATEKILTDAIQKKFNVLNKIEVKEDAKAE